MSYPDAAWESAAAARLLAGDASHETVVTENGRSISATPRPYPSSWRNASCATHLERRKATSAR